MLIHGLTGCPFHCYHCLNFDELVLKKHDDYLTIQAMIDLLSKSDSLYEHIIISGGEYLNANIKDLIHDLSYLKKLNKQIIVYTTGIFLDKMIELDKYELIDGYHLDLKLPYHLLDETDTIIPLTFGKNLNKKAIETLTNALVYVIKTDKGYSQIRSVKYPFMNDDAFEINQNLINHLNQKYHKNTPYHINPFIPINEQNNKL